MKLNRESFNKLMLRYRTLWDIGYTLTVLTKEGGKLIPKMPCVLVTSERQIYLLVQPVEHVVGTGKGLPTHEEQYEYALENKAMYNEELANFFLDVLKIEPLPPAAPWVRARTFDYLDLGAVYQIRASIGGGTLSMITLPFEHLAPNIKQEIDEVRIAESRAATKELLKP